MRSHRDRMRPERAEVTMTQPFLKAYSELLVRTCHRRGAHAMGGMAAQIPIAGDAAANDAAMARVRADKLRERSEEHTSELQSLMRISYAVFCLKKKNNK